MNTLDPPSIHDAYGNLKPSETAFVDAWIATGRVKNALEAAGLKTNFTTTAWIWFRKPQIQEAIRERVKALQGLVPDLIADQTEVLQSLTLMARESEDEGIRLKAWQALERHYNPGKFSSNTYHFSLKDTLDEAERVSKMVEVSKGPHR